ncbi:NAD-dependent epimerase/dehydratase family protein [bacterium]|nr:NAD-dependent epimerase/dehydratase family protein [bacterium]
MGVALVTGSAGLVGAESVRFLSETGLEVVGVDNNLREFFYGPTGSTEWSRKHLESTIHKYRHVTADIRDEKRMNALFAELGDSLELILHTAGQPSHEWATQDPPMDFDVNARGTLVLLECARQHSPKASFVFTSTNKVYGDSINRRVFEELPTRWEIERSSPFFEKGIDETLTIDRSMHSIFGVSKTAADLLVQEYGRYFGMNTVCFRCGCITGPGHSGTVLHGFLAYLAICCLKRESYTVIGYKGKQVRDNIHARDLVRMFWEYHQNPKPGVVYNAGGGRRANCSVMEAIGLCENLTGQKMNVVVRDQARAGDHQWWISDTSLFGRDYPNWQQNFSMEQLVQDVLTGLDKRLSKG